MTQITATRATSPSTTSHRRLPGLPGLLILGFALLQVAWVFVVPPFRASDEFDHAYRAAAVARGQWLPGSDAGSRLGGALVSVPDDLVRAAHDECSRLPYTAPEDCSPVTRVGHGLVSVRSGAGRYNPAFYAVIGTVARPFHGAAALYAMRLAAAALCLAMFLLALAVTRVWARTRWPYVALVAACTPVVMFSTAVAAPNGLEIMAGVTTASALVALALRPDDIPSWVVAIGTAAAAVLLTLRSLGPAWLLLLVLVVLLATPDRRALLRAVARRKDTRIAVGVLAVVSVVSMAWILLVRPLAGSSGTPSTLGPSDGLTAGLQSVPGWVLQNIAVFPYRNQLAPLVVYAAAFLLIGWLLVAAARVAELRQRLTLEVVLLSILAIPLVLTTLTFASQQEVVWQGRYGLPFVLVLLVLAGAALDRWSVRPAPSRRLLAAAVALNVLVQVPGPLKVLIDERATSPGVANGDWLMPSPVLAGVVVGLGAVLMMWGAGRAGAK